MTVQHTEFEAILEEVMTGKIPPPNYEIMEPGKAIAEVCNNTIQMERGRARLGPKDRFTIRAIYFLSRTQRGRLDGEGYVLAGNHFDGQAGRFAICRHEIAGTGTPQQEMRGWHPSHCRLCGLNTSIDSGD